MRRWWHGVVAGGLGAVALGCHTVEHDTRVPLVEEWKAPPNEDRFDNAPEQGYKKPPPKKEWGAKPGMAGSAMGGGPQFGGQ